MVRPSLRSDPLALPPSCEKLARSSLEMVGRHLVYRESSVTWFTLRSVAACYRWWSLGGVAILGVRS